MSLNDLHVKVSSMSIVNHWQLPFQNPCYDYLLMRSGIIQDIRILDVEVWNLLWIYECQFIANLKIGLIVPVKAFLANERIWPLVGETMFCVKGKYKFIIGEQKTLGSSDSQLHGM